MEYDVNEISCTMCGKIILEEEEEFYLGYDSDILCCECGEKAGMEMPNFCNDERYPYIIRSMGRYDGAKWIGESYRRVNHDIKSKKTDKEVK